MSGQVGSLLLAPGLPLQSAAYRNHRRRAAASHPLTTKSLIRKILQRLKLQRSGAKMGFKPVLSDSRPFPFYQTGQILHELGALGTCFRSGSGSFGQEVLVAQSSPTVWDALDCSLPGSSVRGISQARILEWVAIPFPRGSSQPRDQTWVMIAAQIIIEFPVSSFNFAAAGTSPNTVVQQEPQK